MSLSENELRTLQSIETGCLGDDPGFAERMDLAGALDRQRRALTTAGWAFWIGLLMLAFGAASARGLLSIGTMTALCGGAVLVAGTVSWLRHRVRGTAFRRSDHS